MHHSISTNSCSWSEDVGSEIHIPLSRSKAKGYQSTPERVRLREKTGWDSILFLLISVFIFCQRRKLVLMFGLHIILLLILVLLQSASLITKSGLTQILLKELNKRNHLEFSVCVCMSDSRHHSVTSLLTFSLSTFLLQQTSKTMQSKMRHIMLRRNFDRIAPQQTVKGLLPQSLHGQTLWLLNLLLLSKFVVEIQIAWFPLCSWYIAFWINTNPPFYCLENTRYPLLHKLLSQGNVVL